MKYLVIGSGAREHAFAWRLKKDEPAAEVFIAPGNAGTAELGTNLPIDRMDLDGLVDWARRERPDMTIVGPETPLCAGVVDRFEAVGLPIFGPARAAARLEGSKVFTKTFLLKHRLPTAPGAGFTSSTDALAYSRSRAQFPQVIKADGLASGKGVIIAQDAAAAEKAIVDIMDRRIFGDAGAELVIEEFLPGREMSVHVVTDGEAYRLLPIAQDHKKLLDGDRGPNTGGMGAYAPAPFATPELIGRIEREIVQPTLSALRREEIDFRGILYIGLIWTTKGPRILEFNVRGGDPETEVLLPLLKTPLIEILRATVEKRLASLEVEMEDLYAVTVTTVAEGYPENPRVGDAISGLETQEQDLFVFHGATIKEGNKCLTNGGRVVSTTGWGKDFTQVLASVYKKTEKIVFTGCSFRRDIADNKSLYEEDCANLPSPSGSR